MSSKILSGFYMPPAPDAALFKTLVSLGPISPHLSGAMSAYTLAIRYVFRVRYSKSRAWEFINLVRLGVVSSFINSPVSVMTPFKRRVVAKDMGPRQQALLV